MVGGLHGTAEVAAPYRIVTLAQAPELEDQMDALHEDAWDAVLNGAPWDNWESLFDTFADFQLILSDPDGPVLGLGHTVPFAWDGTTADTMEQAWTALDATVKADTIVVITKTDGEDLFIYTNM